MFQTTNQYLMWTIRTFTPDEHVLEAKLKKLNESKWRNMVSTMQAGAP